jgi:hypothetical protein
MQWCWCEINGLIYWLHLLLFESEILDLAYNRIWGGFPSALFGLTNLGKTYHFNSAHSLPFCFWFYRILISANFSIQYTLAFTEFLYLEHNKFNSTLPELIWHLTNLGMSDASLLLLVLAFTDSHHSSSYVFLQFHSVFVWRGAWFELQQNQWESTRGYSWHVEIKYVTNSCDALLPFQQYQWYLNMWICFLATDIQRFYLWG